LATSVSVWVNHPAFANTPTECRCVFKQGDGGAINAFEAMIHDRSRIWLDRNEVIEELERYEPTIESFDGGQPFRTQIAITSYVRVDDSTLRLAGSLKDIQVVSVGEKIQHEWIFDLSNVKLRIGDVLTHYPGQRTTRDSVEFESNQRTWRLTDMYADKWKEQC
jgi:hypothetical protein